MTGELTPVSVLVVKELLAKVMPPAATHTLTWMSSV